MSKEDEYAESVVSEVVAVALCRAVASLGARFVHDHVKAVYSRRDEAPIADFVVERKPGAQIGVKATLIGYLVAGRPMEIHLYAPGKTPGVDQPERKIPFTYTAPKTVIPIGDEGIAGKYQLTLKLDYADAQEFTAELVLGANGEADLYFPMIMANLIDALSNPDAEITYTEGTVHFKGVYDENTHLFTGSVSSDLPEFVLNGASFTITFVVDQSPVTATGTVKNQQVVFGATFDVSADISMRKIG